MRTTGSTPDPFYFKARGGQIGIYEPTNLDLYTEVSAALVPGETTGIFLIAGQSNCANFVNTTYTVTQAKSHMVNPLNGGVYRTKDPVMGCNGSPNGVFAYLGSWTARLGDLLIGAGAHQRVIICNVAAGGTSSDQWALNGDCNNRLICAANRLLSRGMQPTRILWMQGESDAALDYTAQATRDNIWSVCDTLRRTGITAKMMVSRTTVGFVAAGSAPSNITRQGQSDSVNVDRNIILGPDTDTLTSRHDGTHFDATGASQVATLWKDAIIASL